jgi:hypothetical protein
MLQRFELGNEAIAYIRDRLAESQKALSEQLLKLDLDKGRAFVFLPKDRNYSTQR